MKISNRFAIMLYFESFNKFITGIATLFSRPQYNRNRNNYDKSISFVDDIEANDFKLRNLAVQLDQFSLLADLKDVFNEKLTGIFNDFVNNHSQKLLISEVLKSAKLLFLLLTFNARVVIIFCKKTITFFKKG